MEKILKGDKNSRADGEEDSLGLRKRRQIEDRSIEDREIKDR